MSKPRGADVEAGALTGRATTSPLVSSHMLNIALSIVGAVSLVLGVVGGVTGPWAFVWALRDRRLRAAALKQIVRWIAEDHLRENGWFLIDRDDPVQLEAAFLGVQGGFLAFWSRESPATSGSGCGYCRATTPKSRRLAESPGGAVARVSTGVLHRDKESHRDTVWGLCGSRNRLIFLADTQN